MRSGSTQSTPGTDKYYTTLLSDRISTAQLKAIKCLSRELAGDLGDDVKTNNRENESQTQDEDNNGVNAQTGALIGVELEHGSGRATGAGRAGGAGTGITQSLLVVGSGTAAHGSTRTAGGRGRGGTADGVAGGCGGTGL